MQRLANLTILSYPDSHPPRHDHQLPSNQSPFPFSYYYGSIRRSAQ